MEKLLVVFVHGYSVTNFSTYGELPLRLSNEAALRGVNLEIADIFLGRYISFNNHVKLDDLALAFDLAVKKQIRTGSRFVCITHSTGGPLVRNWYNLYGKSEGMPCALSHLIMLAPANHGSALAQLGKSKLSRLRSWFDGVEPGQKILDWLELGSEEACRLNRSWISEESSAVSEWTFFPFVLTGQSIDRHLYDHINSYTGESGSDGVVRVASANLNSAFLSLEQTAASGQQLEIKKHQPATPTAFRIIRGKSHSNTRMGIMKSVTATPDDTASAELIDCIFRCLSIKNNKEYLNICQEFEKETIAIQKASRIEVVQQAARTKYYIHDRHSMVIFNVRDDQGNIMHDFDLLLTAGDTSDPDLLPVGFFADRQCNYINHALTYFFNYEAMTGSEPVTLENGEVIRKAMAGTLKLGISVMPRPSSGFVHYLPAEIPASAELLEKLLRPNATTIVDICMKRILGNELFGFDNMTGNVMPESDFRKLGGPSDHA